MVLYVYKVNHTESEVTTMTEKDRQAVQEILDTLLKMDEKTKCEALAFLNGMVMGKQLAQAKEPA